MCQKSRDGWPIRSDRDFDRIGKGSLKRKIDRMIAIPLDQSRFSRYLYASLHFLNVIVYKKGM